jgi:hypothetical protein
MMANPSAHLRPTHQLSCALSHRSIPCTKQVEVVKLLVNAGAPIAAPSSSDTMGLVTANAGSTPLHLAAMKVCSHPQYNNRVKNSLTNP